MTQITIENARENLNAQVQARIDYELKKVNENALEKVKENDLLIAKKFRDVQARMNHDLILQIAIDLNIADFTFLNVHKRSNERFNIYSAQKIAYLLQAFVKARHADKHSMNVLRNALANKSKLQDDAFEYTYALVRSTCSKFFRDENARNISKLKYRCDSVSAVTSQTQASSTVNALKVLSVVHLKKCSYSNDNKLVFDFDHRAFDLVK